MVILIFQVIKIEWMNKDMREVCFVFLFNKFKHSYLKWLLPDFDKTRTIYDPVLGKMHIFIHVSVITDFVIRHSIFIVQ